jgi:hypothetical protein
MKQVRFVVLDLVVYEEQGEGQLPLDAIEAFRDNATDCLRELGHYIAATQDGSASSTFFLSLIVATAREEPTQVLRDPYVARCLGPWLTYAPHHKTQQALLKPQKFKLIALREALEALAKMKLNPRRVSSPDEVASRGGTRLILIVLPPRRSAFSYRVVLAVVFIELDAALALASHYVQVRSPRSPPAVLALTLLVWRGIEQQMKKTPKALQEFAVKVSYITRRCPAVSKRLEAVLKVRQCGRIFG